MYIYIFIHIHDSCNDITQSHMGYIIPPGVQASEVWICLATVGL